VHVAQARTELPQLLPYPAGIFLSEPRPAIIDGIDPQNPVLARQASHDVLLAQRVARPIVGKTNEV
jgi:hypothetical protein